MHKNIVPRITGGAGREFNFDASLTVGESSVAVKVELNDEGSVAVVLAVGICALNFATLFFAIAFFQYCS